MGQRLWLAGLLAVVFAASGFVDAHAFNVDTDYVSGQVVNYRIDANVRARGGDAAVLSVYAGDQAWEAHDLASWTNLVNNDSLGGNRLVRFGYVDGVAGGQRAQADVGCTPTSSTCDLTFDDREKWYFDGGTGNTPTSGTVDLRAVATHEFGHWLGLRHSGGDTTCPDPDLLSSDDNARPTMAACYWKITDRTIAQDDINGFHVARQGSPLPTANDSFEYTSPTYGWGKTLKGGGGVSRICDGTSYHKSCRIQDTGAGTSIYQDIVSRGGELNSHSLYARAWMRSSSGASISATVAVWNLSTNQLIRSNTCSIGATWSECKTGTFSHSSGTRLRVEVYNNTGTNLNHDLVSLRW